MSDLDLDAIRARIDHDMAHNSQFLYSRRLRNEQDAALLAEVDRLRAQVQAVRDAADWHETKAHKALTFRPDSAAAEMDKAAAFHDDAARRIRATLNRHEVTDADQ